MLRLPPPAAEIASPSLSVSSHSAEEIAELVDRSRSGHRRSTGRLLSIVERGGAPADEVASAVWVYSGDAPVVGVTGAPGSGKSTLVGRLVAGLAASGARPAVVAVDPSSPLTGGAILGDRVRMDDVIASHDVFIRSMATRGHQGGLALAVPGAVRVLQAAGYSPVIVETVGVGQVEVDIVSTADTALVVVTPGYGDAVQANKAGLLEVADVFVVNKADQHGASDARRDLELMLELSHVTGSEEAFGWRPPILMTTATSGEGLDQIPTALDAHLAHLDATGQRADRRRRRQQAEVRSRLEQIALARIDRAVTLAEDEFADELPAPDRASALAARLFPEEPS